MRSSGALTRTDYDATDSHWAVAARAAIESGEAAAPFRVGDHDAAARALADLAICLSGSSFEDHRVHCLEQLALVEACRGRLTRAQELADSAEKLAAEKAIPAKQRRAAGHLARAWVATERQELSRAVHWLDRASRLDELEDDSLLAALAVLLRARLMRDRGNPSAAQGLLITGRLTAAWVRVELEAEARHLAPAGEGDPALDPGDDVPVQTESGQVQSLLHRAEREAARGRGDTAHDLTLEALELARPERLRRPFRHAGPRVRGLIRAEGEIAARADWLSTAGHLEAAPVPERVTGRLPDELTEREHEVLRNLAALLTTQEIAAAMFISVNTVRTHVRHILEKLAATRRNEAVRRARQLGLV